MMYSLSPYSFPRFIDTAGLHRRFAALCAMALILIDSSGRDNGREMLRNARRISKMARALIRAERHNHDIALKFKMLLNPLWQARVLKDLGGEPALKRWERRVGIIPKRGFLRPHASPAQRAARAANLAKAKIAKAKKDRPYKRPAMWDNTHPNVVIDRVKMDFEGQFRLAPIKRTPIKRLPIKRETHTIKRMAKPASKPRAVTGIKYSTARPVPVWPHEFRAAMGDGVPPANIVIPAKAGTQPSRTVCGVRSPLGGGDDRGVRDDSKRLDDSVPESKKPGLIKPRPG